MHVLCRISPVSAAAASRDAKSQHMTKHPDGVIACRDTMVGLTEAYSAEPPIKRNG